MKKLCILEIAANLIIISLMFLPIYCFGIAPLMLIISNVYFAYKHKSKFVLWRLALIDIILFISYRLNVYFIAQNDIKPTVTKVIFFVPFSATIIISAIIFLIYQLILLIRKSDSKALIKVILAVISVILVCAITAYLYISNDPMEINLTTPLFK